MKIKPVGSKILVLPLETKNFVTTSGIEIVQHQTDEAKVIEVSDEYEEFYSKGDTVIFAKEAGYPQLYNGKNCLWIDARAIENGGHIWGKITK